MQKTIQKLLNLELKFQTEKKFREVIEACKDMVKLLPDSGEYRVRLGHAYRQVGDYPNAIKCYQRGISLKEQYIRRRFKLPSGFVYAWKPKKSKRFQDFNFVDLADYLMYLAMTLTLNGDHAKAVEYIAKAMKIYEHEGWQKSLSYEVYGDILQGFELTEGAREAYKKALAITGKDGVHDKEKGIHYLGNIDPPAVKRKLARLGK